MEGVPTEVKSTALPPHPPRSGVTRRCWSSAETFLLTHLLLLLSGSVCCSQE